MQGRNETIRMRKTEIHGKKLILIYTKSEFRENNNTKKNHNDNTAETQSFSGIVIV